MWSEPLKLKTLKCHIFEVSIKLLNYSTDNFIVSQIYQISILSSHLVWKSTVWSCSSSTKRLQFAVLTIFIRHIIFKGRELQFDGLNTTSQVSSTENHSKKWYLEGFWFQFKTYIYSLNYRKIEWTFTK